MLRCAMELSSGEQRFRSLDEELLQLRGYTDYMREQACAMLSRLKRQDIILQSSQVTLLDWLIVAESSLVEQKERRRQLDSELTTYYGLYAENSDADLVRAPPVALLEANKALAELTASIDEARSKIQALESKIMNYRQLRSDVAARIEALEKFLTPELAAGVVPAPLPPDLTVLATPLDNGHSVTEAPCHTSPGSSTGLGPAYAAGIEPSPIGLPT